MTKSREPSAGTSSPTRWVSTTACRDMRKCLTINLGALAPSLPRHTFQRCLQNRYATLPLPCLVWCATALKPASLKKSTLAKCLRSDSNTAIITTTAGKNKKINQSMHNLMLPNMTLIATTSKRRQTTEKKTTTQNLSSLTIVLLSR